MQSIFDSILYFCTVCHIAIGTIEPLLPYFSLIARTHDIFFYFHSVERNAIDMYVVQICRLTRAYYGVIF